MIHVTLILEFQSSNNLILVHVLNHAEICHWTEVTNSDLLSNLISTLIFSHKWTVTLPYSFTKTLFAAQTGDSEEGRLN